MSKSNQSSILNFIVIILLAGILMASCSQEADQSEKEPSQTEDQVDQILADQPEEVHQPDTENVTFWGFDNGFPPDVEYSPDWQFNDGNAITSLPAQSMFSIRQWQNFDLFSRLHIEEGTLVGFFFRAGEQGSHQVLLEPGFAILRIESATPAGLLVGPYPFEPGWYEIHIAVQDQNVSLSINGETIFEFPELDITTPGNIGVVNQGEGPLAIDFIEIHSSDAVHAIQPGEEEAGESGLPLASGEPTIVIRQGPVASLIEIGTPDEHFNVTVRGQAGSVKPNSLVIVANLETTRVYYADALDDGSFQVKLTAFPGSTIQVKHAESIFSPEERNEILQIGRSNEVILEWLNATAGTIMQVPYPSVSQTNEIPFSVSGSVAPSKGLYWFFDGNIEPVNTDPQTLQWIVSGTFYVTSPELLNKVNPQELEVFMNMSLVRHFDEYGEQTAVRKYLVSDFLSSTGFPVFHGEIPWSPISAHFPLQTWTQVSEDTLAVEVIQELANYERIPIPSGYYSFRLEVGTPEGGEAILSDGPTMRSGIVFANGGNDLPLVKVGEPSAPHLFWGLLTDTLHEATRGTLARDDQERIGLLSLISFQDQKYVLPMLDPRTGAPQNYRLEPFLPLVAYGDRGLPNPPTIDFAFPSGQLEVLVTRPDGGTDSLGPAPFVQSVNATPSYDFGKVKDYSNGGGALQDVYQLTTLEEEFNYRFDQYGHYVIEMTGSVDDVQGNTYTGGGTYDLYVARPLKLYTGMLPASPFVEGDRFSPSLQVYPRLPVDVELKLVFLPNSDPERAITRVYTGQANQFGYFFPDDVDPFMFNAGGEYRVDVTAQYKDEQGTVWMGSATWGNVVENKDTTLIAHGVRGLDSPAAYSAWFFHQNLEVYEIAHTFYPYFSGDIFWGQEIQAEHVKGADAIIPGVSIEDTTGEIYEILRTNWITKAHAAIDVPDGRFRTAMELGEVRLFSTTSTGYGLDYFPEQINQYGYVYQTSERPDARVHESVSEGTIPIGYWRFLATYGDQVGVEGDLPNDLKWQFGSAVFRDVDRNINQYAVYGSLWVLIPTDDPVGARVTPPFQGATGGPNGGPILTLKGEDIDLLYLPRNGFPGQVLEVGDVLSFSGHVGPPLNSKLTITVTSPTGEQRIISGQADKIGYFYQPKDDFIVDTPGVWKVHVSVVHDGLTSSGPTMEPYPTGTVLGSAQGSYYVFVAGEDSPRARISSPTEGFLTISSIPMPSINFTGQLPDGFENANYTYTIAMPGFILEQGQGTTSGETFSILYDPVKLHEEFPNLDLTAYDDMRHGLADQVWITAFFEKDGRFAPLTITLNGEEVFGK